MDETTIEVFAPKNENQTLLPCPFCGGKDIVYERYTHTVGEMYRVFCTGCIACIDPGYAQDLGTVQKKCGIIAECRNYLKIRRDL